MKSARITSLLRGEWDRLRRQKWLMPTLITVGSALGLNQLQWNFRNANVESLPSGYLLQEWSSEAMMQTLELKDMFDFGPMFVVYNHVYPPLQDVLRYIYSLPDLVHGMPPNYASVDLHLYLTYAWCFGLVNAVVYVWTRDLTQNGWWSLTVTALWAIGPGYLTNMMLLDPTPLSMVSISWAFYFLYRLLATRQLIYLPWFLAATTVSSWSRNILQWHVLIFIMLLIVAAVWVTRTKPLKVIALSLLLFGIMLILPLKQMLMFGTSDTSTYGGHFRVGMIWINPHSVPEPEFPPDILGSAERFQSKWNTTDTLRDHYRLSGGASAAWTSDPIQSAGSALRSLTITVPEALRPASHYTENYLVASLPWKGLYDWVFSGWRYVLLVLGALAVLWIQRGARGLTKLFRRFDWFVGFYLLVAAPVLWSNRYIPGDEDLGPIWTDAVRLKMFLEVPVVVLIAYSIWSIPSLAAEVRRRREFSDGTITNTGV
jgi:hypothetical protein